MRIGKTIDLGLSLITLPAAVLVGFTYGLVREALSGPQDDELDRWLVTTPREDITTEEAIQRTPNHPTVMHANARSAWLRGEL